MNRQPRALLSVLLIGVDRLRGLALVERLAPGQDDGAEIVVQRGRDARRHAGVVAAQRAAHASTASSRASVPVDLYSILTGSKLVRVNRATQEVEPALAETWTISPDNLTYTLTLRDGVTWSDGDAFTSADVLFSFQAIYDPKVDSLLASVADASTASRSS